MTHKLTPELLQNLIEQSPVAVAMFDKDMRYIAVSSRWLKDYDLKDDVIGRSHYDVFPEVSETWRNLHKRALLGETLKCDADPCLKSDGTPQWLRWEIKPWFNNEGQIGGIRMFSEIITDIINLKQTEEKYRKLLEAAHDAIVTVGSNGLIELVNEQALNWFGYSRDELIGQPIEILVPAAMRAKHVNQRSLFISSPKKQPMGRPSVKLTAQRKNGTVFPVDISLSPSQTANGVVITAFIRDITEQRRREEQFQLLANCGRQLARSLDLEETLDAATALSVPAIADAVVIRLIEGGELGLAACHHADPNRLDILKSMIENIARRPNVKAVLEDVVSEVRPYIINEVSTDLAQAPSFDAPLRIQMQKDGFKSFAVFPLEIDRQAIGSISFISDISNRHYSENDVAFLQDFVLRISMAINKAKLYQQRENILAVVSHDLKTPLGVIDMAARLILEQPELKGGGRYPGLILQSTARMQRLILDLQDYAKISSGSFSIHKVSTKVSSLMLPLIEAAKISAERKKITLQCKSCGNVMSEVLLDSVRMGQVVSNLLSNAVQYTPEAGKIDISVQLTQESFEIVVTNSGPGIPATELPYVFERFWRGQRNLGSEGSGLGLYIAKSIVEAHGGKISVNSDSSHGTKFSISIPVAGAGATNLDRRHILVVDDSSEFLIVIKALLESAGAKVTCVSNIMEALRTMRAERPDLVLTDIEIGSESGYDLLRRVKSLLPDEGRDIPVAAMTGHSQIDEMKKLKEAGFAINLVKPLDSRQTVAALGNLIDKWSS